MSNIVLFRRSSYFFLLLILTYQSPIFAEAVPPEENNASIKLASYNIRNGKAEDGANHWDLRKDRVVEMIRSLNADVIGLQEAYPFQRDYLLAAFPDFDSVGIGRNGEDSEAVNIFVSKSRFKILDSGTFWLSDTPDKKSRSLMWFAYIHRICSWVFLEDKESGKQFYFFNTHYDHFSETAREKSSQLLLEKVAQRQHQLPYIVGGDFNALSHALPITRLVNDANIPLSDSFRFYDDPERTIGTFNGFEADNLQRIDFIFTSPQVEVERMDIYEDTIDGYFPSDHFPVSINFSLAN